MAESKRVKAHTRYRKQCKTLVPGVTTVLNLLAKPALVPWANRLGLQGIDVKLYVDDKADIGTLGHAMVTDGLLGIETDVSDFTQNQVDSAENCALSFWEWEQKRIEETFWVERPLVSELHSYGGTADIYCLLEGRKELIDLKTGKGIWPEHVYQVATLKHLLEENGYPVDRCRILNIPRTEDESFEEKILTPREIETGWQIFQHCLAIYYLKKNGRG